jgi:antitoxin (DNA-binding transcriptional repressor) of toxin-antitoxin stability system
LERVLLGEEIIIAKGGKPIARLVPIKSQGSSRLLGIAKGEFVVPDDFNEPMPEFEKEFYGEGSD